MRNSSLSSCSLAAGSSDIAGVVDDDVVDDGDDGVERSSLAMDS